MFFFVFFCTAIWNVFIGLLLFIFFEAELACLLLPQAQHEAQGLLHVSLQRQLHHHQGQQAPLPGMPAEALRGHRHDERV